MYKQDLALNNQQRLIGHNIQPTNQPTNQHEILTAYAEKKT